MNINSNFPFKLIQNNSNKKNQLSFTLLNKDYYLLNLLHKNNKENNRYPMLSDRENNNNKLTKKRKKIVKVKELNINNIFHKINIKHRNKNSIFKESDNFYDSLFFKTKKKIYRYNSCHFNLKDKIQLLEPKSKLKSPLVITPLNKINNDLNKPIKNKRNKLTQLKRSFTYKTFYAKEKNKIKGDYILTNSPRKNGVNTINNKKNEGTQINNDCFHNKELKNRKVYSTIHRKKYCSPKSIIFQRQMKFLKKIGE